MIGLSFLRTRLSLIPAKRAAFWIGFIGFVLTSSSLGVGKVTDDFCWSAVFQGAPGLPDVTKGRFDTFSFSKGEPEEHARFLARGIIPWWTDPHWRIAFFRPLSSLSHYLDFTLWRNHVWFMHVHSMFLYGLLAYATTRLYQRHVKPAWVAGLAGLLFAVDSAHGLSVGWLSNRNAILSTLCGVLVLLWHDRWRQGGSRRHALAAAFMLIVGLLCGEGTVAVAGYLFAYAWFIDRDAWWRRLASLAPYLVIVAVWRFFYSTLGYGVTASSFYTDPLSDPQGFLKYAIAFLPILLHSQFAFPDPIYRTFLPSSLAWGYVALAVLVLMGLAWAFWPLLRREASARFYCAGMILAAVPYCSSTPQYRLLMFVGVGGMGLLALFLGGVAGEAACCPASGAYARLVRPLAAVLVVLHLIVAPIMLPANSFSMQYVGDVIAKGNDSLPMDPKVIEDRVIVLNATGDIVYAMLPMMRSALGQPVPRSLWVLYSGNETIDVHRADDKSLVLTISAGWMEYPWSFLFCRLPESAMTPGQVIETDGLRITVLRVNEEGRPQEARFTFDRPLEDPSLRWFTWRDGAYRPFPLPAPGENSKIPALSIPTMVRQVAEAQSRAWAAILNGQVAP